MDLVWRGLRLWSSQSLSQKALQVNLAVAAILIWRSFKKPRPLPVSWTPGLQNAIATLQTKRDLKVSNGEYAADSIMQKKKLFRKIGGPVHAGVKLVHFRVGTPEEPLRCAWILPKGQAVGHIRRAILYVHGGLFVAGSIASHRRMVSVIVANSGIPALMIDYRLAPVHKHPVPMNDVVKAFHYLVQVMQIQSSGIVIAGDSTGATLALLAAAHLQRTEGVLPCCLVFMSPFTRLFDVPSGGSETKNLDSDTLPSDIHKRAALHRTAFGTSVSPEEVSPVNFDLKGFPPMLIQAGTREQIVDDTTALAAAATGAGVSVDVEIAPQMPHCFQIYEGLSPHAQPFLSSVARFCDNHAVARPSGTPSSSSRSSGTPAQASQALPAAACSDSSATPRSDESWSMEPGVRTHRPQASPEDTPRIPSPGYSPTNPYGSKQDSIWK